MLKHPIDVDIFDSALVYSPQASAMMSVPWNSLPVSSGATILGSEIVETHTFNGQGIPAVVAIGNGDRSVYFSDILRVTEDPRFKGLTSQKAAIQVTA